MVVSKQHVSYIEPGVEVRHHANMCTANLHWVNNWKLRKVGLRVLKVD